MELYFGQQHPYNIEYFGDNWVRPYITETPCYKYVSGDRFTYRDYIEVSWRLFDYDERTFNRKKKQRVRSFNNLIKNIKTSKVIHTPIQITKGFDGKTLIVDGNHRAAIGTYLGIDIPVIEIDPVDRLHQLTKNENLRYGSNADGIPYQSIVYKNEVIVEGRRNDIEERFSLIDLNDIKNKKIIDFGSNLGANLFKSIEEGATSVLGLEVEDRISISAIRIATIFGYNAPTRITNLAKPVEYTDSYDTGFCFSINRHVKNDTVLAENIANSDLKTLYFEAHDLSNVPKEIASKFEQCEHIGNTFNDSRRFFKLTR